ncbi:Serum response factor like protein B [Astathelohania contejeani]|uniref:Serum response factor like protein B n=1 Tax=Astathelohania contejeani TaxID=164912 RepID=A0ABQ7HZT0_9MICR|nr:Serum response factor like protein B [Thelohania contejeani]
MNDRRRRMQQDKDISNANQKPVSNEEDSNPYAYTQYPGFVENRPENYHYPYESHSRQYNYPPYPPRYGYDQYPPEIPQYNHPITGGMAGTPRMDEYIDSEEDDKCEKKTGRKKIKMAYICKRNKRSVTFSKRKKGIMKKAYELNILTGTQILLLVASESGHVYTFATPKLKPIISKHEHLIQECLNSTPNPPDGNVYKFEQEDPQAYEEDDANYYQQNNYYPPGYNSGYYYDKHDEK